MKIHNRFFEMSKQQIVFRAKSAEGNTYTIVPYGPYAGVWTYGGRYLQYFASLRPDCSMNLESGRVMTLPLPRWMYEEPKNYWKEQKGNYKCLMSSRTLWISSIGDYFHSFKMR